MEKTFLTITPESSFDLKLDIEKALYTYLSLPYSEYLPSDSVNKSIENKISFQALKNQVDNFKQNIEVKNSIIELKSISNEELRKELDKVRNKLLLLESMKESEIEIFGGALTIKEYELGPIKINPKKLVRLVKNDEKV